MTQTERTRTMNETIFYRPYRSHTWFLFLTIPVGLFAFIAAGYGLPDLGFGVLGFVVVGIACIWSSKRLYDSSHIAVFFEQEGLRMVGGSYHDYRFVLWKEIPYAYCTKSFKGHTFLVLSPKVLSTKEAKNFANRGANSSKICIDYVVVIHMDVLQNISQLKEWIDAHVFHVETY